MVNKPYLEEFHKKRRLEAPEMANKTSALSAKQRSARLKFLKGYESVTVNRGRDDYLFLDKCLKYIFPAT